MQAILQQYDISELRAHQQDGTLTSLHGIATHKAKVIDSFLQECDRSSMSDTYVRIGALLRQLTPTVTWPKEDLQKIVESHHCQSFCDSLIWLCALHSCTTRLRKGIIRRWFDKLCGTSAQLTTGNALKPEDIEEQPLILTNITRSSWKDIDNLALANGWWEDTSKQRFEAYAESIVFDICNREGHTYITFKRFEIEWNVYRNTQQELPEDFVPHLKQLVSARRYICIGKCTDEDDFYVSPTEYFCQEEDIVCGVDNKLSSQRTQLQYNYTRNDFLEDPRITDEQLHAINGVLNSSLSVLTGKGGTGKTSCVVKNVVAKIKQVRGSYILLSPTHAAKKNAMREIDDEHNATCYQTIHSYTYPYTDPLSTKKTCKLEKHIQNIEMENPQGYIYVFVEESSMVDRMLFSRLFSVCGAKSNVHLTLLGDVNQLPAIGAGQIFSDMVDCELIPTYRLETNFRSKNSDIPRFCDMILGEGEQGTKWDMGTMSNNPFQNVKYHFSAGIDIGDIEAVLAEYRDMGYLPSGVGTADYDDDHGVIQVITNRNRTCEKLVPSVRKVFHKALLYKTEQYVTTQKYAKDDPVMLKKNNSIFKNGDQAVVTEIFVKDGKYTMYQLRLLQTDPQEETVSQFLKHEFCYKRVDGSVYVTVTEHDIKPMLARTVHSTQGLGFDTVLYVLEDGFPLDMNMHYTAYSRAKKNLHLFGSRDYFSGRKARTKAPRKNSFVAEWLEEL